MKGWPALILLALAAACAEETTGVALMPTQASLTGSYVLQTVNGANVPATFVTTAGPNGARIDIVSDVMVLNQDGSFTYNIQYKFYTPSGGLIGSGCDCDGKGSYSINQAGIVMLDYGVGRGAHTATVNGNQLAVSYPPGPWVYNK